LNFDALNLDALNFDIVAIYRNAFVGALAGIGGWLIARVACGPLPAANLSGAAGQGAIIGFSLAVALGLISSQSPRIDRKAWLQTIALHAFAGLVAGALTAVIGLWAYRIFGGLASRTFAWVALGVSLGTLSGMIHSSWASVRRMAYAGLIAGLIGGSSLEAIFVWARSSSIQIDLATTMAGVYGLGLFGGLLCALVRIVDDLLRSAWVLIETGPHAGRSTTLDTHRGLLSIGSGRDCQIQLPGDEAVLLHHAAISREDDRYMVEAIDGVTFAGAASEAPSPIKRTALEDGSEICVGAQRIRFRENRAAQ
jgi:hypothetical protein